MPSSKNGGIEDPTIWRLLRGSLAGSIAKTCVYPFDRLKMIYQVKASVVGHFHLRIIGSELVRICRQEGVVGLWKGNLASFVRTFPHSGIVFFSFDKYEAQLKEHIPNKPKLTRLLAGGGAGVTSTLLTYPLDVWNTRMAVSRGSYRYRQVILHTHYGWTSLYRGLWPTIVGIFPYAGISFFTFETLKSEVQKHTDGRKLNPILSWVCGGVAGITSQTVTYPLDTIRKFMQANTFLYHYQESGHSGVQKATITSTAAHIYKTASLRGFFNGVSLNWFKGFCGAGLSFMIHESLKNFSKD